MNTKTTYKSLIYLFFTILVLSSYKIAVALPTDTMNYQGHLTDSSGIPVDAPVSIVFAIYNLDVGGFPVWSDSRTVNVDKGVFSVELGGGLNPFPPGMFDLPLWVGISVGTDAEMIPRRPVSGVGFSFKAGDAETLDGVSAATLDQSAHVIDMANPHNVTTAQIGAISGADLTAHKGDISAHHVKTSSFPELSGQISDAQIPALIARDAEIMSTVLAGDGPGSTLNADLLDGFTSGAFMFSGTDLWVNTTGDTMTGPLTVGGALTAQSGLTIDSGGFTFDSGSDIRIHDSVNGFRWYDSIGTTQFAYFIISNSLVRFQDVNTNRALLYSNANGIGIDTLAPTAGYSVTAPSLDLTSNLNVGTTLSMEGTGSANALSLGTSLGTADDINIYHAISGLRVVGPNSNRIQYGSAEWIEDGGTNTTLMNSSFLQLDTPGGIDPYIGDDGAGGDVQLGSNNPATTAVALWNRNTASRMDLHARQIYIYGGADLAEPFDVSDDIEIEPGMIVSIDPEEPGLLKVAEQAYDRMVAGIVSGANGINPGVTMQQEGTDAEGSVAVALTGRVYALVDTKYGSIEPGDLLTTSNTPGYAMKVTDYEKSQGSIVGKAMTSLQDGKGHVLVLITLQ